MTVKLTTSGTIATVTDTDGDALQLWKPGGKSSASALSASVVQKKANGVYGDVWAVVLIDNDDIPALIDFLRGMYREEVECDNCNGKGKVLK